MAAAYPFTDLEQITAIVGQLGIDLRLDDLSAGDADDVTDLAIDEATWKVYGYLAGRYSMQLAAANGWVQWQAAWFAVLVLCRRRLNDVAESVQKEWDARLKELEAVRARKMDVPDLAHSRRPVAVTNYSVDLRRFNNGVRVDKSRSTGLAKDYRRPVDESSPDQR